MLDTGTHIGVPTTTPVPAQGTVTVQFTGRNGIPASGVSAIQANIITISPTATGSLFAWPTGETVPTAPNFYFYASSGFTSSASTVRLSATGQISFKNGSAGTVRILADVTGYYTDASSQTSGNRFVPLKQSRVIDTRNKIGVTTNTPVPANTAITVTIASKGGLPAAANITAAVVNVTAWSPTAAGGWTMYPGGSARPSAYHGNFAAGKPYTNSAVVQLSSTGSLTLFNVASGTTHYTVDVVGYFTAATNPAAVSLRVVPVAQQRVLDTGSTALVPVGGVQALQLFGKAGLPAGGVTFAALRVTAYGSATSGEVVTYPGNETRPTAVTDVAPPSGNTLSYNLMWARVSPAGIVSIVNGTNAGVRMYVDVQAYAVAPSKPQPPSNVTGGARDQAVEVRWDPPTDSGDLAIAGYDVLTSPGGQSASTATGTSVVVQGLTNGTSYTFQVRAKTAAGTSDYSAASQAIKPAVPAPPGAPFITDTLGRDGAAVVTWSAPEGAVDQVVSYKVTTVPATTPVTVAGDEHTATLTGLTNDELYKVVVTATNANGSTASTAVPVTPKAAEVPLKPVDLALFQLDSRLDIQWVQPADGGADILDYEVTADPGDHRIVIPAGTTVTGFTGLDNGTMYTVKVRARNKTGTGDWSEATGTPSATRPPNAPTDLQASVTDNGTITVAWEPPIDTGSAPITGYHVTASPGGRVVDTTSLSAAVDGLDQQTQYTFVVSALNMHGAGLPTAASRPIKPTIAVAQDPIVLTADSLSRIANVGTTSISVTNPNAQLNAVQAGDIIVATSSPATPEGLLRKVLRVDTGTVLVFQTEDAALSDVLSDGALSRDIKIKDSDGLRFQQQTPGATLRHPTVKGKTLRQGAPRARAGTSATVDPPTFGLHDGKFTFEFTADIDRGVHLDVAGSLDPSFEVSGGPSSDQSEYTIKADTDIEYRVDQSFWRGEKERRIPIGHLRGACVAVYVGRLPVELCPGIDVYLVLTVEGRAGVRLVGHSSGQFGDHIHRNGNTLTDDPFGDQSLSTKPDFRFFGNVDETLAVEPDIVLLFYGTAGPYVTAKPYVRAEADTDKNPFIAGFLGVQLTGGLTADLFKKNVLHHEFDGFRWEHQIFDSGGPIRNVLIDPPSAELAVGETIDLNSHIFGYPDEPATWSVVKGPGTVSQDGVYDAVADGVVRIKAEVPANGVHDDLEAEAGIYVGPHVPTPPRDVAATPGNLAANVTWREPAQSGGNPIDHYVLTTSPDTGTHTAPGSTLSAVIDGLRAGVSYVVSVYAVTNAGQSEPSTSEPVVAGTPLLDNPGANDLMRGMAGTTNSMAVELSDDGRYAFFPLSVGPNEVAPPGIPQDGNFYLVRRDLTNGQIELASRQTDGKTPQVISTQGDSIRNMTMANAADGRFAAYIVDGDDGMRRRVLVYDFDAQDVWSADPGTAETIEHVELSDAGTVVALDIGHGDPSDAQGYFTKVLRVVKGAGATRIDMCTSSTICDSATLLGMPADGNTLVYGIRVDNNQSPYYNKINEYVFYNASSGQASMPYYQQGGLPFGGIRLSRNGQYFAATATRGPLADPTDSAVVVKRVGAGVVTDADVIQGGYRWDKPPSASGINDDGNIVAWAPGLVEEDPPPSAIKFVVQDRTTGARTDLQDLGVWATTGASGMSMSRDGSVVAWTPGPTFVQPTAPRHPMGQRIG
ncbi:fibronectin type III domain-containing protein [Kribbella sp. NBC_00662]|uniref:fibronectin type III domain-containing protein n=1 Tax=Kribbella sp. NBC_00662 TaxID=2975969 RepID=UPI00324C6A95